MEMELNSFTMWFGGAICANQCAKRKQRAN